MDPGIYNFKVYPGADVSLSFAVTGMDLSGYTARSKMRAIWDASIEHSFTVALVQTTAWRIDASMPGATTTTIQRPTGAAPSDKCSYYWDLEIVAAGGQIYRLLQGTATVFPEATR
jgi:hypothetical protein